MHAELNDLYRKIQKAESKLVGSKNSEFYAWIFTKLKQDALAELSRIYRICGGNV